MFTFQFGRDTQRFIGACNVARCNGGNFEDRSWCMQQRRWPAALIDGVTAAVARAMRQTLSAPAAIVFHLSAAFDPFGAAIFRLCRGAKRADESHSGGLAAAPSRTKDFWFCHYKIH
jgi:hypothetical protein